MNGKTTGMVFLVLLSVSDITAFGLWRISRMSNPSDSDKKTVDISPAEIYRRFVRQLVRAKFEEQMKERSASNAR